MKETDVRAALANKLREFRMASGLTTKEVGDRIGKSSKTVSGWEHGRGQPDADMLFTLCEIFGVTSISAFYPPCSITDAEETIAVDLSADEKNLVQMYRALNVAGQDMIMTTLRSFVGNPELQKEKNDELAI